ncbi:MAG TPA: metallophosphoesterase [Verrucomicrobiae bacterium]|nr:metallophosphoesterase [Verrucomicrobiae bacterium]
MSDPRIKKPVRILFISDLHITWFTPMRIYARNLSIIKREHKKNPYDLILLGGDYFDRNIHFPKRLNKVLAELISLNIPIVAVLGNHDTRFKAVNTGAVREILQKAGITLLENDSYTYTKNDTSVLIVGLKDLEGTSEYLEGKFFIQSPRFYKRTLKNIDAYQKFDDIKPELFRILLSHNPDCSLLPGSRRPDLAISGHTHGGQAFFLTWLGLVFKQVNPHGSFQSQAGIKSINGMPLIISRGFGYGVAPFRYGAPPDVYAITLNP